MCYSNKHTTHAVYLSFSVKTVLRCTANTNCIGNIHLVGKMNLVFSVAYLVAYPVPTKTFSENGRRQSYSEQSFSEFLGGLWFS